MWVIFEKVDKVAYDFCFFLNREVGCSSGTLDYWWEVPGLSYLGWDICYSGACRSRLQTLQTNKGITTQLWNDRSLSNTSQFNSHPAILRYSCPYCLVSESVQFHVTSGGDVSRLVNYLNLARKFESTYFQVHLLLILIWLYAIKS
jgi:hypothetical protein